MKYIEQKVIKFIDQNRLIERNDRILVALSGGPDSVFLLYFLDKYKKRFGISIAAFHLNHMLRGKESDGDETFCREISISFGNDIFVLRKRVKQFAQKNKYSIEEAGRIIRYREMEKIAVNNSYNKIATGHNLNDHTETVLLNLIKGAGMRGLSGIPVKRDNIVRPILVLEKSEIVSYLEKNKIPFRTDQSNVSTDYERNFLRNEIIPLIKSGLNPSLENAVLRTASVVKSVNDFIQKNIDGFIKEIATIRKGQVYLSVDKLLKLDKEIYGEIFKSVIDRNFFHQTNFSEIKKLSSLLLMHSGKQVALSNGLSALRERKNIVISNKRIRRDNYGLTEIKPGEVVKINGKTIRVEIAGSEEKSFTKYKHEEIISADGLRNKFILRKWKPGDYFHPLGMKGKKKVSDFLTDLKLSTEQKSQQLVLLNEDKIVWVVGLRIDDRVKVTTQTKRIFRLCLN